MNPTWRNCPYCKLWVPSTDDSGKSAVVCPACGQEVSAALLVSLEGQGSWYYEFGQQRLGPFSIDQIRALINDGRLQPTDSVLPPGATKWVKAASLPPLFPNGPPRVTRTTPHQPSHRRSSWFRLWANRLAGVVGSAVALVICLSVLGQFSGSGMSKWLQKLSPYQLALIGGSIGWLLLRAFRRRKIQWALAAATAVLAIVLCGWLIWRSAWGAPAVVRIPPGTYPLQIALTTDKWGTRPLQRKGSVRAFFVQGNENHFDPSQLTKASGPVWIKRVENGREVERRKFEDALGTWIEVQSPFQEECSIAISHLDNSGRIGGGHAVDYELEVGNEHPVLLGGNRQRLEEISNSIEKSPMLLASIAKADEYAQKLSMVFANDTNDHDYRLQIPRAALSESTENVRERPPSGVVRAFNRFRQECLEVALLSSSDPAALVDKCIADFGRSITTPDPKEALCLLSIVHGDALSQRQIRDARQELNLGICESYQELEERAGAEGHSASAIAAIDNSTRTPTADLWRGLMPTEVGKLVYTGNSLARPMFSPHLTALKPRQMFGISAATSTKFGCANFAAIVRQLLFTYTDLRGPKITVVREWDEGKTHWTEYLIQYESSRADAFMRDVLNNYRSAGGGPPCERLQNAINKAQSTSGGIATIASLDWNSVIPRSGKYAGEPRDVHVRRHNTDDPSKDEHGVFHGDGVAIANEAWARAHQLGLQPDKDGSLNVPMNRVVGHQGGQSGARRLANGIRAEEYRSVTIKVVPGTNQIITAYPGPN